MRIGVLGECSCVLWYCICGLRECVCATQECIRRGAMPMLASDGRPLERGNAHAHVAARAQTGRTLRAVVRPQCPCSCQLLATAFWAARGANLTLPTEGRTGHSGRSRKFREPKR